MSVRLLFPRKPLFVVAVFFRIIPQPVLRQLLPGNRHSVFSFFQHDPGQPGVIILHGEVLPVVPSSALLPGKRGPQYQLSIVNHITDFVAQPQFVGVLCPQPRDHVIPEERDICQGSLEPVFLLDMQNIIGMHGVLQVLTTVFLANTVDYGELKNNRRDESVIFSMQTFVVKLASGISGFLSSMVLFIFNINSDKDAEEVASDVISGITTSQRMGLRLSMTLIPIAVLLVGGLVFKKHYILTDEKMNEITTEIEARH